MRDRCFVAMHRGGTLDLARHRLLALWAADCAERVLPLFEQVSDEPCVRRAIDLARAWAAGEIPVGQAQIAAVAAHAAARQVTGPAATAAARSAGHAVATAHMADHALGASLYALKAVAASGGSVDVERAWQIERLPESIRELVTDGMEKLPKIRL